MNSLYTPKSLDCAMEPAMYTEGQDYFKKHKVIIAGLLRDSADTIQLIEEIVNQRITPFFADYRVLVVENDSKDDTREKLLDWKQRDPKVTVLGCGIDKEVCKMNFTKRESRDASFLRISRMVDLRNIYLDYIRDNSDTKDFDFVIVWDYDITGTFYVDGLGLSGFYFKQNPDILAQCANGTQIINLGVAVGRFINDSFAYKEAEENPEKEYTPGKIKSSMPDSCGVAKDPKLVTSCFNGFTIYRKEPLVQNKYRLIAYGDKALCEHHTLNASMKGVYLNPRMVFISLYNK